VNKPDTLKLYVIARLDEPGVYLSRLLTGPVEWSSRASALIYDAGQSSRALHLLRSAHVILEPVD
jgi:hypothetical protein